MSLQRNIIASYASQIYVTLIGIFILPVYLKYMGAEAYGLVGFFTMLQAWFNLLDMGLTPTVARETARFKGGATDVLSYRRLLRSLQLIFVVIALLGGGAMFVFSASIADSWLNVHTLPLTQVQVSLQFMAVSVALRWMSGLYRGCLSGAERLVWLGGFNALIATLRFVGVLPVLIWVGNSPTVFFTYQLIVAVFELVIIAAKSHRLLPAVPQGQSLGWSFTTLFAPIKPVLTFSVSIAFTSSAWVLVTQTDKLVLSKLLPLAEYGYFTLAVLAASGVMMVSGPISAALLPRMARLHAEANDVNLIALYRNATKLVAMTALTACFMLSFFSEKILWMWTGDLHASVQAAPVLRFYAIGNGFLAMAAFPYYLQFAKGNLKLHLSGSIFFLIILFPLLLWAVKNHGAIGAGYAWAMTNAIYFIAWPPLVHSRFIPGFHKNWILNDILPFALIGISSSLFFTKIISWPENRTSVAMLIILASLINTIICAALLFKFRPPIFKNKNEI